MNFTFWGDCDIRSAARKGHSHIGCIVVHIHSKGKSQNSVVSSVGNPQGIVFLIKCNPSRARKASNDVDGCVVVGSRRDGRENEDPAVAGIQNQESHFAVNC